MTKSRCLCTYGIDPIEYAKFFTYSPLSENTCAVTGCAVEAATLLMPARDPDGRTVANRNGRKKHTDGHASSSDCTEYGHTDTNRHTDTWDTEYLARFPQAVKNVE